MLHTVFVESNECERQRQARTQNGVVPTGWVWTKMRLSERIGVVSEYRFSLIGLALLLAMAKRTLCINAVKQTTKSGRDTHKVHCSKHAERSKPIDTHASLICVVQRWESQHARMRRGMADESRESGAVCSRLLNDSRSYESLAQPCRAMFRPYHHHCICTCRCSTLCSAYRTSSRLCVQSMPCRPQVVKRTNSQSRRSRSRDPSCSSVTDAEI